MLLRLVLTIAYATLLVLTIAYATLLVVMHVAN